jgi:Rrf2 family nitric oxide-sensitive transcriptional repressor
MKLSLFSDYSLRTLLFAALKGSTFQIDEVTSAYGISRNHLAKVVQNLSHLGYLETRRGRNGGIRLAVNPEQVRLGQLLRRSEAGSVLLECFNPALNTCPITGCCRLKGILSDALQAFYTELDRHTLKDLVDESHRPALSRILLSVGPSSPKASPEPGGTCGENG